MIDYYKYLPVGKEDENWGLCVLNVGCTRVGSACGYPINAHPDDHNFRWQTGRVLSEYQIIYVTEGHGLFESDSFKQAEVKAGTIILLFPGERHRYRPSKETGWDEYWVGFKGKIMDDLVEKKFFKRENPCINLGFNEHTFNLFNSIIEKTKREDTGYQPQISGATLHLLGCIHSVEKEQSVQNEEKQIIINKARLLFRSNITKVFSPEQAAQELMIGYSHFRKLFKTYTGISPGQFYIQLKIEKAKELLCDQKIPIKEIAYELQFDSYFYFSRLFKEKTGLTPSAFRLRANGKS
ncbi:AraC family transcriptional regulator [Pedobacter metabolipauper]|uniref:AraC-like protein n=1 Tax=Pedobacter metabolipauper TaxID=425513 RepID=A0A4R6SWW2_9SPHI|nr:AraC family transcriptional regulator [Pedobacter metabolipauper]TDQ08642.1 AraC-like protein [Pedobacter metabolipauper]